MSRRSEADARRVGTENSGPRRRSSKADDTKLAASAMNGAAGITANTIPPAAGRVRVAAPRGKATDSSPSPALEAAVAVHSRQYAAPSPARRSGSSDPAAVTLIQVPFPPIQRSRAEGAGPPPAPSAVDHG